jgi:hypothetical protein
VEVARKEESKTKHLLGLKHINIPHTAGLMGVVKVVFRRKGETALHGYPEKPE